ncbi:MAG: hypothetical protein H6739_37745 [Alphaproteobacteria bacterium]|nr:hypothetical protein [Alphaproteobacteria bacterium]
MSKTTFVRWLGALAALLISPLAAAQDAPLGVDSVSVGYFGEIVWHPGLSVAAEWTLVQGQREKERDRGPKVITRSLVAGPELAGFVHPRTLTALQLGGLAGYRKVRTRGFTREYWVGAAVWRGFLGGDTYTLVDGQAQKVALAGRWAFAPSVALGLGQDLSRARTPHPVAWTVRPRVTWTAPTNASTGLYVILELNLRLTDLSGWMR